ncbi:Na+/H+ antiporter subunit E [Methanoculleus frigidifontis]|nr:Na+/H+ antiporter subunit E [Methanoculleus sp. FWC-SCC1]
MTGDGTLVKIIATFGILFAFWAMLSTYFDAFHLIGGVICSAIVAVLSHDLLIPGRRAGVIRKTGRFIFWYVPWLLVEIFHAGFDVAYRVLHPSMPIAPSIISFDTGLSGDVSRTVLANSMTLTPGTLTVDVEGGVYIVHSLCPTFSRDATMQKKVAAVFEEKE